MNLNNDTLTKTSLFKRYSDYLLFSLVVTVLLAFSLLKSYQEYLELKQFTWHQIEAKVISQNRQNAYTHYKLQAKHFTFRTTSKEYLNPLQGRKVKIAILTESIDFKGYLKGFYAPSRFEALLPDRPLRTQWIDDIHSIHTSNEVANLYAALYLAQPIMPELRSQLTDLGINHLAAISGFHLGLISFFILFIAHLLYKPLHANYLPYRNRMRDIMIVTLAVIFVYVAFLDFTPSLLRAYGMMLIGFILYDRGLLLLSLSSLGVTVLLLLALFPDLFFSMGFWLSVLGVFHLFLILRHWEGLKTWQLFIGLHLAVFVLMIPWVIFIFHSLSMGQLLSPILSMLFIVFYPISMILMLLGLGSALDSVVLYLLHLEFETLSVTLPLSLITVYVIFLLLSIIYRKVFHLTLALTTVGLTTLFLLQ